MKKNYLFCFIYLLLLTSELLAQSNNESINQSGDFNYTTAIQIHSAALGDNNVTIDQQGAINFAQALQIKGVSSEMDQDINLTQAGGLNVAVSSQYLNNPLGSNSIEATQQTETGFLGLFQNNIGGSGLNEVVISQEGGLASSLLYQNMSGGFGNNTYSQTMTADAGITLVHGFQTIIGSGSGDNRVRLESLLGAFTAINFFQYKDGGLGNNSISYQQFNMPGSSIVNSYQEVSGGEGRNGIRVNNIGGDLQVIGVVQRITNGLGDNTFGQFPSPTSSDISYTFLNQKVSGGMGDNSFFHNPSGGIAFASVRQTVSGGEGRSQLNLTQSNGLSFAFGRQRISGGSGNNEVNFLDGIRQAGDVNNAAVYQDISAGIGSNEIKRVNQTGGYNSFYSYQAVIGGEGGNNIGGIVDQSEIIQDGDVNEAYIYQRVSGGTGSNNLFMEQNGGYNYISSYQNNSGLGDNNANVNQSGAVNVALVRQWQ